MAVVKIKCIKTKQAQNFDPDDLAYEVFGDDMVSDQNAMYQLGLRYASGAERELDLIEAHKWFNLAALHGSETAAFHRKDLARHMTAREIVAAQRSAREWLQARG